MHVIYAHFCALSAILLDEKGAQASETFLHSTSVVHKTFGIPANGLATIEMRSSLQHP
jgi:hypothetical protein